MGISHIFQGNVTDGNTTELFELKCQILNINKYWIIDMYGGNESVTYLWSSSYPLFIQGLHSTRSALLCLKMFSNNTDRYKITASVKHIVSYIFSTWTYLEPYKCTNQLENISNFWRKPIIMRFDGLFPVTFTEPLVVTQWTPRKLQRNNCEFH